MFPDLGAAPFTAEGLKKNLIMPEPCQFISGKLPRCSIVRPTATRGAGAVATIHGFNHDGLFIGHGKEFIEVLFSLAAAADRAKRER